MDLKERKRQKEHFMNKLKNYLYFLERLMRMKSKDLKRKSF